MCGHFGIVNFAGQSPVNYDKFMKDGFVTGSLRGKHSCGLFTKSVSGRESLFKKAVLPWEFLEEKGFNSALFVSNMIFMGHNRWATRGKISDEGAHPFNHEHITLAHNGTLLTHRNLTKGSAEFDIDSEAICHYLSVEENTNKVLEDLNGDYALVWFNDITKTFNFARNTGRELYLAYLKDKSDQIISIFYASEKGMLTWLCERNNIPIDKPFLLESGEHWEIFMDKENKGKIEKSKFTPKEKPKFENYYQDFDYSRGRHSGHKSNVIYSRGFTSSIPHKHLSLLRDRVNFIVCWTSWMPYKTGYFGKLIGYYDSDLKVEIHGIKKEDISNYLNGKRFIVQAQGWDGTNQVLSAKIISAFDDTLPPALPPPNEHKRELTSEELRQKYLEELDDPSTSKSKKKSYAKSCSNCDFPIEDGDTALVINGITYCSDCIETYEEYFRQYV